MTRPICMFIVCIGFKQVSPVDAHSRDTMLDGFSGQFFCIFLN